MTPYIALKHRKDFLNVQGRGRKQSCAAMLIACLPNELPHPRLGLTVTRKLGNAVIRNRIRRRLREAARATFPQHAREGHDYVIIARPAALARPFPALKQDMADALDRLHPASPIHKPA